MKIKYCGPAKDYSGYGEANRHDIAALVKAGVLVTTQLPSYTTDLSDFGELGRIALDRENDPMAYQIKILHTTPDQYRKHLEPGKFHIGRVFWETDKLPPAFAINVNLLDEIWTGSEFNAQAIRNAGVNDVPIKIIPEAIDTEWDTSSIKPYKNASEGFVFYSLFEWTERKNPTALIQAFCQEFSGVKDVSLVIKSYVDNFHEENKQEVRHLLQRAKRNSGGAEPPPIYLYPNIMDRGQIYRFHRSGKVFVSAHRGEGWGVPQMEAMLMGNPIISTNLGGIHEYLTHKENALLVDNKLIPLTQNSRNMQWYLPDQKWAAVDLGDLKANMRWAYEHQDEMKEIGLRGQETVKEKFSLEAVGTLMRNRLIEINDLLLERDKEAARKQ